MILDCYPHPVKRRQNMTDKIQVELESIKKLLILNLISQGIPHAVVSRRRQSLKRMKMN